MRRSIKLLILLAVFAMIVAACSSDSDDTTTTTAAAGGDETTTTAAAGDGDGLIVGVSWNNFNEERWAKADEKAMLEVFDAQGVEYISTDAGSSAEQQLSLIHI